MKNGFAHIIVIIVLSILLIGGVYFLGTKNRASIEERETPIVSFQPQQTPETGTTTKSYVLQDIKFSYPSDWNSKVESPQYVVIRPIFTRSNESFPGISIYAKENPDNFSVKEFDDKLSKEGPDPEIYSILKGDQVVIAKERKINNITGYYFENIHCEPLPCDKFTFSYNKKIYMLTNIFAHQEQTEDDDTQKREEEEMKKVFNQVIQSIKTN
ncbi:hypothetical protein KBA63_04930 [Candidatus Woesebacteria bacterium]|nr:hypothetical protein [Candidatus Woesebacteria bacterium]MBP9687318.1 hypothetical protein [Candidatus Woesebacteria bacterium]